MNNPVFKCCYAAWQRKRWNENLIFLFNRPACGGSRVPNYYGCKEYTYIECQE